MTLLELMEATDAAEEATTPDTPISEAGTLAPFTRFFGPRPTGEELSDDTDDETPGLYKCSQCGADNHIVNQCGCDPHNLPTDPEPDDSDGSSDDHKAARRAAWNARQAARIARYENRAANAATEADRRFNAARQEVAGIPFGQPILVGHHSESKHRGALKRHDSHMDKGCEAFDKSKYWEGRAQSAASNNAIMSDDPDAGEKLEAEIARLEARQQLMTAANKCARKMDCAGLLDLGFNERQVNELLSEPAYSFEKRGFQSYQLSNNNANIRRLKQRLAAVKATETATTTETEAAPGVRIVDNVEENRLQIFFPDKPSDEVRKFLKGRGFRWSPNAGAWQRHRSNGAHYDAAEAVKLYAAE